MKKLKNISINKIKKQKGIKMEKNYLKKALDFVVKYLSIDFGEDSAYMQSAKIKGILFGGYHKHNSNNKIMDLTYNPLENIIQNTNFDNNQKQQFCEFDYE
jgi:hemerythrin